MANNELLEKYPYAFAHHPVNGKLILDVTDGPFCEADSLPHGWRKLFWQCMEDIRPVLEKAGLLNTFYFQQVKEKYGEMRLYASSCPEEVSRIIDRYTYISNFVCEQCGKPATKETQGWVCNYCVDCAEPYLDQCEDIEFDPIYLWRSYSAETGEVEHKEDVSDIWNRLYNIIEEN